MRPPAGRTAANQWRNRRGWKLRGANVVAVTAGTDLWTLLSQTNPRSLRIADAAEAVLNPAVREIMARVAAGSGDEIASVWFLDDIVLRLCDPLDQQVLRLLATFLTQPPG